MPTQKETGPAPENRYAPEKPQKDAPRTGGSFVPLYATTFFGTLNDNFLKTLVGFIVTGWIEDPAVKTVAMGVTVGALVMPYVFFSPLADRLTALFPKTAILRAAKWAEFPIVAMGAAGFALHSAALAVGSVVLMGLQSALYSPAKYALVRDIGGEERISTGMGGMEGVSFSGVMAGTVAAAFAADLSVAHPEYGLPYIGLGLFAACGLVASFFVKAEERLNRALHSVNPLRYVSRARRIAAKTPGLPAVLFALSMFWGVAAMLQTGLLVYGTQVLGLDSAGTGLLMCGAALGIVAGQVTAGFVDAHRFLMGCSLATGWLAAALLAVLAVVPMPPAAFGCVLALLAFDLGFFKLPLDAEMQKTVKGPRLNTVLAYFNQISFVFILAGGGVYALTGWLFGPSAFLPVLAAAMFLASLAFVFSNRKVLLCTGRWLFRRRYRVRVSGAERAFADPSAAYLVLPCHPAIVDPMLVATELWKIPLCPLCDESFFHAGILAPKVLKTLGAVPVPDLRKHRSEGGAGVVRGLFGAVKDALADGKNVLLYPGGHIWTEPRESIGTRQMAYNVCKDLPCGARVVLVRTSGLWGSIWSRKGRKSSPAFLRTLAKSALLWPLCAISGKRRNVEIRMEDMTEQVKEWAAALSRTEFNRRLEEWYNG